MYKRESGGWLKHYDFLLLDMICLQIAFLLSFVVLGRGFNPYSHILYRKMALYLELADVVVVFFFDSFSGVLKKGYYRNFVSTVQHAAIIFALSVLYLFLSKEGQLYSRLLSYVRDVQKQPRLEVVNSEKKEFVISNAKIVERFTQIDLVQIVANAEVQKIEQSDDAINILGKYKHLHNCIVCDNDHIDGDLLLQRKKERRKRIYESLDARTKALLKDVAMDSKLGVSDPFEIKKTVLAFIASGEMEAISSLREEILTYVNEVVDEM